MEILVTQSSEKDFQMQRLCPSDGEHFAYIQNKKYIIWILYQSCDWKKVQSLPYNISNLNKTQSLVSALVIGQMTIYPKCAEVGACSAHVTPSSLNEEVLSLSLITC